MKRVRVLDVKNRTKADRNGAREKNIQYIGQTGTISHRSKDIETGWVLRMDDGNYIAVYEDEIELVQGQVLAR